MDATAGSRSNAGRALSSAWWPILAFTICYLPFVGKAFHIDDPMYLWAAKHIQSHPLDFYGFLVNWRGTAEPMAQVMRNPPLVSYWLAAVGFLAGWSEVSMHLALLLPAVAVVAGTHRLARDLDIDPVPATLFAALSPAFLVSSTTITCDVLMLSAWVWAIQSWMRGIREERHGWLALGASLIVLAALSKYFGIALIPLLAAYAVMKRRRLGNWLGWLFAAVAVLAAYELLTRRLYGAGHILDATLYTGQVRERSGWAAFPKLLTTLAFIGGGYVTAAFFAPRLWSRRAILAFLMLGAAIGVVLGATGEVGAFSLRGVEGVRWSIAVQVALLGTVGVTVLLMSVAEIVERRDTESALLGLWMFGTFAFAARFNWTVAMRSVLPMAPAVGILLSSRLARRSRDAVAGFPLRRWWPAIAGALVAVIVAIADARLAAAGRAAAQNLAAEVKGRGGTAWFQGHWGFQYYAELAGLVPMDYELSIISAGDVIIVPESNQNLRPLPAPAIQIAAIREWPVFPGLSTMNYFVGAAFYSDVWGPLPFSFAKVPDEAYAVVDVVARIQP